MLRRSCAVVGLLASAACSAFGAGHPSFAINGKVVRTAPPPVLRNGRVYVPVYVLRKLGLLVIKDAGKGTVEVVWPDSDSFLYFKPGRVWVVHEGPKIREETIDRTPFLRRGTLMVPLHVIAQDWKYDFSLEWNPRTVTANLIIDHQRGVWFYRLEMERARRSRPKIAIDGREVTLSPAPVIRHGRLYVPAQQVFGALGLVVKTDGRSGQITVIWPDTEDAIFLEPGRVWVVDDSGVPMRERTLDRTPFMLRDTLMMPMRVVAREWNGALAVDWHPGRNGVDIRRVRK